jgi:hypothetical protein
MMMMMVMMMVPAPARVLPLLPAAAHALRSACGADLGITWHPLLPSLPWASVPTSSGQEAAWPCPGLPGHCA